MYDLTEYSNNHSKSLERLWQYYKDKSALTDAGGVANSSDANNNNASFKFKQKITGKTAAGGIKNVEIMVTLKYLSNFWRTHQMPLINLELNIFLA